MFQFRNDRNDAGLVAEYPILGTIPVYSDASAPGMAAFASSGLSPSTLIETENGPVPAGEIKAGTGVVTRENGIRPVLWAGCSRNVLLASGETPVRIQQGALQGKPGGEAQLFAPGHKLLVHHRLNELLFGTEDVLIRAADLAHVDGIDMIAQIDMAWVHLLLDTHEIIRADGLWVETLKPDMKAIEEADHFAALDIYEAVPRLRYDHGLSAYFERYPELDENEAGLLEFSEFGVSTSC